MTRRTGFVLGEILAGVLASAGEDTPPMPDEAPGGNAATLAPAQPKRAHKTKPKSRPRRKHQPLPPWNVVLLDDDDHTYDYVVEMLGRVFGHNMLRALLMAREVDASGRVIVYTTHRELAELKREQILGFGTDPRIASCRGSMSALIEPAQADS